MKAPVSWLKQYLDLPPSLDEIIQTLTLAGLEVEHVESQLEPILDIALTPNLGHCLSLHGIARELSALLNLPLKKTPYPLKEGPSAIADQIHISLIDRRQCSRYACRKVDHVQVGPSPEWLQKRLASIGLRSINNVVDVGNYVMFDKGQPLHLFDYDLIANKQLIITSQTPYGSIETLDGISRDIPPSALLICDPSKPLAFGGIMGAANSAVSEKTRHVLIESAYFAPASIRKTAKLLNLRSDASYRFERGIDPNGLIEALNMAAYLLQEIAGGTPCQGLLDIATHAFEPLILSCRIDRLNAMLGTRLSFSEVQSIFHRLQFPILEETPHALRLAIPTYRNDITAEIDLIEEVARLYGYQNIPLRTPVHIDSTLPHDSRYLLEKTARSRLISQGLRECITCNLISPQQTNWHPVPVQAQNLLQASLISVLHPSSIDQSVLRPSLLPGLLQIVQYNLHHFNPHLHAFEIGNVHFKNQEQLQERTMIGIVLTGKQTPYHWDPKPRDTDFFDLKGKVENFLHPLPLTLTPSHLSHFHPGRQAHLFIEDLFIGSLGEIHPDYTNELGVEQRVYFAEIDLHVLHHLLPRPPIYPDVCPFPGSERDWTLTLPDSIPIGQLIQIICKHASPYLEQISLLDLYKSQQIGKDRKNITFRFYYRDLNKTIDFETVEQEHTRLIQSVTNEVTP